MNLTQEEVYRDLLGEFFRLNREDRLSHATIRDVAKRYTRLDDSNVDERVWLNAFVDYASTRLVNIDDPFAYSDGNLPDRAANVKVFDGVGDAVANSLPVGLAQTLKDRPLLVAGSVALLVTGIAILIRQ